MTRRTFCRLFVSYAALGVAAAACGPQAATPTASPAPTRPADPSPTTGGSLTPVPTLPALPPVKNASFAYAPVRVTARPAVAPYAFATDKLNNPDLLRELNEAQRELLTRNGFVATTTGAPQLHDIYKQGKDRGVPLFVTTDAVLHTYHILYDYVLRSVEMSYLMADARNLTLAMLAAAEADYGSAQGSVRESARLNMAYFAVASKLLDSTAAIPNDVRDLAAKELALIDAHKGYAESPIFGYKEDYSQYIPRGHYTRNDQFKAYFRGMMWYGRIGFRLKPGAKPDEIARGREETRRALLMVAALERSSAGSEPALKVWDRIYGPTTFFVGASDDLTVYDYQAVASAVYGHTPSLQDLNDAARLDVFIARAMTLRSPRIVSSYVTDREKPEEVTKSFRFMGQRFIPDSYIFQQLVYDKVGTQGKPRIFPKGLDVLAVFGSERAYAILDAVFKETSYTNYKEQMAKLRAEFGSLPATEWVQNLYWGWLYSLLPLATPKGPGYPAFMLSEAWTDKQLHTALGSWAELRHDTILYAKQSTTIRVTSLPPQPAAARGYVEPNPEVYARLAALAAQTRSGLQERAILGGEFADKLARFEQFLLSLKTIAEKELAEQARSDQEYELIRSVGEFLENVTTFSVTESGKLSSEADKRMAVVADVHTDTNTDQALEEGVGDAFPIYVIVPIEGVLTLAKGGVFSYYEFTVPLDKRMTDEQWQQLTPKPDRPVWTQSFIR